MRNRLVQIIVGALALVAAVVLPASAQQQAQRVGFINMQVVLRQTPGYAEAESTYTREAEGFRLEVQRLQAQLDSAASQFERDAVLLSPSAREARREKLQAQQDSLEVRFSEIQERAARRERELLEPIQQRVNTVVEDVRKEGNYAMIFDVSAVTSTIVAADQELDVTALVVGRLQTPGK